MSSWVEAGYGEQLGVADAVEPLRHYLTAAFGSEAIAEEIVCDLFESFVLLPSEMQPKTKNDWFLSVDGAVIQRACLFSKLKKSTQKANPALSKFLDTGTSENMLFLSQWLNTVFAAGKGSC